MQSLRYFARHRMFTHLVDISCANKAGGLSAACSSCSGHVIMAGLANVSVHGCSHLNPRRPRSSNRPG